MCEVIAFPSKKQISKETEEKLYKVAKDYIEVLYEAMDAYIDEDDDLEGLELIHNAVAKTYAEALAAAIEELDEDSD